MRDQEKCPKLLISRRRGGLFKHQNNSFFDLERHHLVRGTMVAIAPFFLVPQPLRLNILDGLQLQASRTIFAEMQVG